MSKSVLGIDVSKDTLDVVLLNAEDNHHAVIGNNEVGFLEINKWLRKHEAGKVHVYLEATGQYSTPIAEHLFAKGHQVSVINPLRIKAYGQSRLIRNKTDKLDAYVIAEFCMSQKPSLWTPPEAAVREVQELVRHLEDLQSMFKAAGIGRVASICGRYYAMDRDNRWERTQLAYDLMTRDLHSWNSMLEAGATTCMEAWAPDLKWVELPRELQHMLLV